MQDPQPITLNRLLLEAGQLRLASLDPISPSARHELTTLLEGIDGVDQVVVHRYTITITPAPHTNAPDVWADVLTLFQTNHDFTGFRFRVL